MNTIVKWVQPANKEAGPTGGWDRRRAVTAERGRWDATVPWTLGRSWPRGPLWASRRPCDHSEELTDVSREEGAGDSYPSGRRAAPS